MIAFFVVAVLSIILLFVSRKTGGGIGSPSFMITFFWVGLTLASIIGTVGLHSWGYLGIIWIYLALFLFNICYFIGDKFYIKSSSFQSVNNRIMMTGSFSTYSFYLFILFLAFGNWVYFVYTNGFSLNNFMSLASLAEMNNSLSIERYSGGYGNRSPIAAVLGIAPFAAVACAGFSYPFKKNKKETIFYVSSCIPCFLSMMTDSTKSGFIAAIFLFFPSMMIGYYYAHSHWPVFSLKKICFYFVGCLVAIMLLVTAMVLRMGSVSLDNLLVVEQKFIMYAFGSIFNFDLWLSDYYSFGDELTYGIITFLSLADSLGLVERVQGVFDPITGSAGNVYTVFRGIIMDFGIIGGLLYTAFQGLFLGLAVSTLRHAQKPWLSPVISVAIMFFMFFGMTISPWTYRSFLAAVIIFAFYLLVAFRFKLTGTHA